MKKENKKTIIITIVVAVAALALIAVFTVNELISSGVITTKADREVLSEFYENYNSKERTIIYYASPSCSYCQLQEPILETIADDYDLDYYYLDASSLGLKQRKEVLEKLGIEHATPTTIVVEKGKVIDTAVGYKQGKELVKFFVDTEILPEDAEFSGEKNITFIDYKKYGEIINNGETNVVVVGKTNCGYCTAFKPTLNTVAGEYDITINYLNLAEMSEDESNSFFNNLGNLGYDDADYLKDGSFGTPTTLIFKNGKIVRYFSGQRTISQLVREFTKSGLISE